MKNITALLSLLLSVSLLLGGCAQSANDASDDPDGSVEAADESESIPDSLPEDSAFPDTVGSDEADSTMLNVSSLPEDFVFPVTDGSTSTTNLDNAVRSAILGGEQKTAHSKTYMAFENLLDGRCELIFVTPLSEAQLQTMERLGFRHEAEPVAGEGFVFVVNKDNPVDTLTIEQLKGIYSGEITNWSEVGGNDAEIIAYQRNEDSGSQNYMISFMGDTPLMKPVTEQTPATMSGILDVVASYDNGINAIGYSVYAYSDGMYENIAGIKYIRVNGVEPSPETLADGSYPLLGYNYAVFSASEPEDSNVRALVGWMQSDEGQQVIADAGYIPYRRVEGLTLPESTLRELYSGVGSSGIPQPETMADYYYDCPDLPVSYTADGLDEKLEAFIAEATDELLQIDESEIRAFLDSRVNYGYCLDLVTRKELINGYLSVKVGWRYFFAVQDSPDCYYDVRTAVFDIYTGERLELSDLFFEGIYYAPLLNNYLAAESTNPYSTFGSTYDMVQDFTGLHEGDFAFTATSIIFKPGVCFADGVELSLSGISEYMTTSLPRDMSGWVDENTPIHRNIRIRSLDSLGYAEEKNGIAIWYLDKDKAKLSAGVCDKINSFIDRLYEANFTEEKLLELVKSKGFETEEMRIGPWPDFELRLIGNRYIWLNGANLVISSKDGEYCEIPVIEGHYNPYCFAYYFDPQTGDELRMNGLFTDGWEDAAKFYVYDDSFNYEDLSANAEYTDEFDIDACRILYIWGYTITQHNMTAPSGPESPVEIFAQTESGDWIAVTVPVEYIR